MAKGEFCPFCQLDRAKDTIGSPEEVLAFGMVLGASFGTKVTEDICAAHRTAGQAALAVVSEATKTSLKLGRDGLS